MDILNKLLPAYDKLKHNYIGNLAYVLCLFLTLKIGLNVWVSSITVIIGTIIWEVIQKLKRGTNTSKEQFLDVLFSNITHILITTILHFFK